MSEGRRHPDLFTAEEAALYLCLDSERCLETLRRDYGLVPISGVNKGFRYWREDLDAAALRWAGRVGAKPATKMRMAR